MRSPCLGTTHNTVTTVTTNCQAGFNLNISVTARECFRLTGFWAILYFKYILRTRRFSWGFAAHSLINRAVRRPNTELHYPRRTTGSASTTSIPPQLHGLEAVRLFHLSAAQYSVDWYDDSERKRPWPTLRYYLAIYLECERKTRKTSQIG
jgi:hypothetical protein